MTPGWQTVPQRSFFPGRWLQDFEMATKRISSHSSADSSPHPHPSCGGDRGISIFTSFPDESLPQPGMRTSALNQANSATLKCALHLGFKEAESQTGGSPLSNSSNQVRFRSQVQLPSESRLMMERKGFRGIWGRPEGTCPLQMTVAL